MSKMIAYQLRHQIRLPQDTKPVLKGYKDPLTPVSGGYGYIGTLAYNRHLTHVQCHICGYYFKGLSYHVSRSHGLKTKQYKDRYGIMRTTSLMSPVTKQLMAANTATKRHHATRQQIITNLSKGWDNPYRKKPESLELKNKKGRCPEQLLRKVLILSEKLGKTPTKREFIKEHGDAGDLKSIYRTFGSWNSIVRELGLEPNKTRLAGFSTPGESKVVG